MLNTSVVHDRYSADALSTGVATPDWMDGLPVIAGSSFVLREMRLEDAPALLDVLNAAEVSRFTAVPPATVAGIEQFIIWAHRERMAGSYACFAVVPHGMRSAAGMIQLRSLEPGFGVAEWGFALASRHWGNGMFAEAASRIVDFAVDALGAYRLEARVTVMNGRGNGLLRKIGAVQEGTLRRSFERNGTCHDQVLWGIAASDWRLQRMAQEPARLVS